MKRRVIQLALLIALIVTGIILALPAETEAVKLDRVKKVRKKAKTETTITIKWPKVERAKAYQTRVATKSGGEYTVLRKKRVKNSTCKKKNCFKKYTNLEAGTKYYFRVRAKRKKKFGRWSRWQRIKTTPPENIELQNLLVSFAEYDPETGKAGDFVFDSMFDKTFLEFGAVVQGPDGDKVLPTFEYLVDADAELMAPLGGEISYMNYQEDSADYEIHILNSNVQNQLTVGIDHVLNPQVAVGDVLEVGDVIGNPGTHSREGFGRTEIEIFGDDAMHCVFEFFDESLREQYEEQVTQMMADWEAFKGDDTLYDEEAMSDYAPGCIGWEYTG